MHAFELAKYYPSEMATLRNKKKLASVARECEEVHPRNS